MDVTDIIRAVLEGAQSNQPAAGSTPTTPNLQDTSSPPRPITHDKRPTPSTPAGPMPPQPGPAQTQSGPIQTPQAGDVIGSILGGIVGAAPTQAGSSNPLGDILGTMMGAGLGSVAANTVLAPIIDQVAQRFDIPPRLAQMVVAFALAQIVQSHLSGGTGRTAQGSFQTQHLVNRMAIDGGLDAQYLAGTGLPHELAQRTGLDPDTSARALQFALSSLGSQVKS